MPLELYARAYSLCRRLAVCLSRLLSQCVCVCVCLCLLVMRLCMRLSVESSLVSQADLSQQNVNKRQPFKFICSTFTLSETPLSLFVFISTRSTTTIIIFFSNHTFTFTVYLFNSLLHNKHKNLVKLERTQRQTY